MEGENKALIEKLEESIREASRNARLFRHSELSPILEAAEVSEAEERAGLIDGFLQSIDGKGEFRLRRGKQEIYIYSSQHMSDSYADILVNSEEKNVEKMIVDHVRRESEIYPRPSDIRVFAQAPFSLSKDAFVAAMGRIKSIDEYNDIVTCAASNKAEYVYSTRYLSKDHAQYLVEWYEVEQELNP